MSLKYTHLELNKDVNCIAGFYTPQEEIRLKYSNREVLCVVGQVVIESSCCGAGSHTYALVPGYIVSWQNERNSAGLPVSEVEPVSDEASQNNIRKLIKEARSVSYVEFW